MPTASDLVTDLPADFEVFGQAVDTRLKALQPGTTLGDIAYSSATANTNTRLPIGTSGQVLGVSGGVPAWVTSADQTPLTTKGDVFTFTTVDARLGVGANGTVLTADSAEATGLKWATPSSGGMTLISTTTLSSTSTTISSIPSGYTNLQMVFRNCAHGTTSNFFLRFNGVTSNSYTYGFNNNPALSSYYGFDNNAAPVTSATYNAIVEIYDYANTSTALCKQVNLFMAYAMNATPSYVNGTITGGFFNSAAISSITISTISGAGTLSGSVLLYGVK
jgi:hypothetical protein